MLLVEVFILYTIDISDILDLLQLLHPISRVNQHPVMIIIVDKSVDIVARQFEVSRFILGDISKRRQSGMSLLITKFSYFIRQEVTLIIIHFS